MPEHETLTRTQLTIRGESVPILGFGTWQLTGRDCREGVRDALELGYRHIDTAQMYENEHEVGRAIASSEVPREDIFLVTKLAPGNESAAAVQRATDQSLAALRTDSVDLLLIHWPSADVGLEETLDAMTALQDTGKTRRIGLSNFTPSLLDRANQIADIFALQVEYHPYLDQSKLIDATRANGQLFTAYCPLARGRVLKDDTLRDIGNAHGKSPAQVALRWLIQQDIAAIPKASSAEHRRANLEVFDFERCGFGGAQSRACKNTK